MQGGRAMALPPGVLRDNALLLEQNDPELRRFPRHNRDQTPRGMTTMHIPALLPAPASMAGLALQAFQWQMLPHLIWHVLSNFWPVAVLGVLINGVYFWRHPSGLRRLVERYPAVPPLPPAPTLFRRCAGRWRAHVPERRLAHYRRRPPSRIRLVSEVQRSAGGHRRNGRDVSLGVVDPGRLPSELWPRADRLHQGLAEVVRQAPAGEWGTAPGGHGRGTERRPCGRRRRRGERACVIGPGARLIRGSPRPRWRCTARRGQRSIPARPSRRKPGHIGDLLDRQPAEKLELHDAALAGIENRQPLERLLERDQLRHPAGPTVPPPG